MDEQDVGVVDRVGLLRRIVPGRIMLDVQARASKLGIGQDPRPVDLPVRDGLEQDGVDIEVPDVVLRHLVDAIGRPAPVADPTVE
jgi:hypothetical protein